MKLKRVPLVLVAFVLVVAAASCSDTVEPLNPVDPQFAKGGKPGGGPSPSPTVDLVEYYVFQDGQGQDQVHIVARGDFATANLNVVQDYYFNGYRDDDGSPYYEYTTMAPDPVPLEGNGSWDEALGAWHMDIPWDGMAGARDPNDPTQRIMVEFPDFPHVALAGGDPYAFDLKFQAGNGDILSGFQPHGIILGGTDGGATTQTLGQGHHPGDVRSYAVYASSTPPSPVWIEDIGLASDFTCQTRTVTEGRGKTKTTRQVTELSGNVRVALRTASGPDTTAWMDVSLAQTTGDPLNPVLLDTWTNTHSADAFAAGYPVTAQVESGGGDITIQVAVPYVYATLVELAQAYDPSLNQVMTRNRNPVSEMGQWPLALSQPVTLTCR